MRFYVWTEGNPGYFAAEVAVRDLKGADEARSWAADWWNGPYPDRRIISRSEALMRPTYRTALEAWERRDDDVMQTTEVAQIRSDVPVGSGGHRRARMPRGRFRVGRGRRRVDLRRCHCAWARRALRRTLLPRRPAAAAPERG